MIRLELNVTDNIRNDIDSFLNSLFSKISPQCNIPNGNQRDESWALVCFSYRSPLEGKHLGKVSFNEEFRAISSKWESLCSRMQL